MKRTVYLALWLTESDPIVFVGLTEAIRRRQVVDFISNAIADAGEGGRPAECLGAYDRNPTDKHFTALTEAFEPWWCGRFQFTTIETPEVE